MGIKKNILLFSLSLILAATVASRDTASSFDRTKFPKDFIFGAGIAAYQAEGSPLANGRGPCIWDNFVKNFPDKIADESTGEVTDDFYHRYKEDIKSAKEMGLDSFRLSISWSRIFPKGKISRGLNTIGVQFYSDVIDEILANGLKPFVTLLHFDPPQALEYEYGGLLSTKIVADFEDFADFCFKVFGERVKYWVTINEPNVISQFGYDMGVLAPGRCSPYQGDCPAGNSATEPYMVAHTMLLCHATVARLYKEKYQATQKGQIGITVAASWFLPIQNTESDRLAASRALDFNSGWFFHPLTYGEYPASMRKLVGSRLPKFTKEQSKMLINSFDFLTVNYYSSYYVYSTASRNGINASYSTDGLFSTTGYKNGIAIGAQTASSVFFVYPEGLYNLLTYIKKTYNDPQLYITENGFAGNGSLPLPEAINDEGRISFLKGHLAFISKAIKSGVKVKGYYVWSFMDVWEWDSGFSVSYGLIHVNFKTLQRTLKASALWYKKFLIG